MKSFAAIALLAAGATAQTETVLSYETTFEFTVDQTDLTYTYNSVESSMPLGFWATASESLVGTTGEVGVEEIASDTVVSYSRVFTIESALDRFEETLEAQYSWCTLDSVNAVFECQIPSQTLESGAWRYYYSTSTVPSDYFTAGGSDPVAEGSGVVTTELTSFTSAGVNTSTDGNLTIDNFVQGDYDALYTYSWTLGDGLTYADIGSEVSSPCELLADGNAPQDEFEAYAVLQLLSGETQTKQFIVQDMTEDVFEEFNEVCSGAASLAASAAAITIALLAM